MMKHAEKEKSKANKEKKLTYAEIAFDETSKDGAFRPIIRGNLETTLYTEVIPSGLTAHRPNHDDEASSSCVPSTGPPKYMNTGNLPIPRMTYENVQLNTDGTDKAPEVEIFEVIADHDCLSMSAERLKVRRGDFVQADKVEAKRALCCMVEQQNAIRGWIPRDKLKLVYTNTTDQSEDSRVQTVHKPNGSLPVQSVEEMPALPPKSPDVIASAKSSKSKRHDSHLNEAWFVGKMSRTDCEKHFNDVAEERNFIIRESTYRIGDYTLSVQFEGLPRHFPIKLTEDNRYYIGKHNFKNLCNIVTYYGKNPLFHDDHQKPVSLGEPLDSKKYLNRTTSC